MCIRLGSILLIFLSCTASTNNVLADENALEAGVEEVRVSGRESNYTFFVTVKSPDNGCSQYADWWEVLTPEGELIYRRVLLHSHTNEQPFARSGGAVSIAPDQRVLVRVHMNNTGYSRHIMSGSVNEGFEKEVLDKNFASELAGQEPLPKNCAF